MSQCLFVCAFLFLISVNVCDCKNVVSLPLCHSVAVLWTVCHCFFLLPRVIREILQYPIFFCQRKYLFELLTYFSLTNSPLLFQSFIIILFFSCLLLFLRLFSFSFLLWFGGTQPQALGIKLKRVERKRTLLCCRN